MAQHLETMKVHIDQLEYFKHLTFLFYIIER